jgi:hypothetical protein
MELFGRVQLTTVESPNAIEFVIVQEHGSVELVVIPAILLVVIWEFWQTNTPLSRIVVMVILIACSVSAVARWVQGGITILRVTSDGLKAKGNLGKLFTTEERIAVSDIESIGFRIGNENEPSGLYVKHGWSHTCMLPGLNEEQVTSVMSAILDKFPNFAPVETGSGLLLFGTRGELTTLGLSALDSKDKTSNR